MNSNKIKAVVYIKYGPPEVLRVREMENPTPGNDEELLKIFATSVTASDFIIRGFKSNKGSNPQNNIC